MVERFKHSHTIRIGLSIAAAVGSSCGTSGAPMSDTSAETATTAASSPSDLDTTSVGSMSLATVDGEGTTDGRSTTDDPPVDGSTGSTSGPEPGTTTAEATSTGEQESPTNVFGITRMFPTTAGGLEWDSLYWDDEPHAMGGVGVVDVADPLLLANRRGSGALTINGDGTLTMTGSQPRLYVGTVDEHPWLNVEVTVYYQRIEDDDTNWAGLVVGARGGPDGHGGDNCTATTYYARFRQDGTADVEKELEHPASASQGSTSIWDGADPPFDTWIGLKYVVTNVDAGQAVRLRVFRDMTDGVDGGTWEPIIDYTDAGGWAPPHNCGYADDLIITEGGGIVFVRNTGLLGDGARYKWVTIREIEEM